MCTIYIIRHGQTDLNKKRVLQSRIDAPLNDDGIMQAEDAKERLRSDGIFFDMIFSSPLKRAVQTVRIIAGDSVLSPIPGARIFQFGICVHRSGFRRCWRI